MSKLLNLAEIMMEAEIPFELYRRRFRSTLFFLISCNFIHRHYPRVKHKNDLKT